MRPGGLLSDRAHVPAELSGPFQILGEVGKGAFGRVLRARDRRLERLVAIKVSRNRDPDRAARFLREAEALSRLEHPHIVRIYDYGVADGLSYLVMEHLDGESLDRLDLDPEDALEVLLEVADALDAVHAAGMIHRDLKPSNIVRTRDGRTVLLDFGLAYDPDRTKVTREGYVVGTPVFMAPELLRSQAPGRASDWYAWGVILFEVLEGRDIHSPDTIMKAIRSGRWPPPAFERTPPNDPRAQVAARCLAEDPAARPRDGREIRTLLGGGSAIRTRALPGPSPGGTPTRAATHRPRPVRVAAAGWAALVLLLAFGWARSRAPATAPVAAPPPPPPATRAAPARPEVPADMILLGRNEQGFEEYRNPWDESEMVLVPGATYTLRATRLGRGAGGTEVQVPDLLVAKHEVDRARYSRFLAETGRDPPVFWDLLMTEPDRPACMVRLEDAEAYARWAHARLPTLAEWILAAGGPGGRRYPWGDAPATPDLAQYDSSGVGVRATAPPFSDLVSVRAHPRGASPYGILNMAGNVAEWTTTRPGPAELPGGAQVERFRCVPGGSWIADPEMLEVLRYVIAAQDTADQTVGIRIVRPLEVPAPP